METLQLADLLHKCKLDLKNVKLVRHPKIAVDKYVQESEFEAYQAIQERPVFHNCDFIVSFIGGAGTTARFIAIYQVEKVDEIIYHDRQHYQYSLCKTNLLSKYQNHLIIEWGSSARQWVQRAHLQSKEVLSISEHRKLEFVGYDKVRLSFAELATILGDNILYENWHVALASINAIYLIADMANGKQYVGSAYGSEGLLGRWRTYVTTKHGNNKYMMELSNKNDCIHESFQFSILQIIPKTLTADEVITIENLYKEKLLTREFGMNSN